MTENITIAVALGILAASVSGLAGHLAATEAWHKWFFWLTGLAMIALISLQAYRNETAQGALQKQLDKIQTNTENPRPINIPQAVIPTEKHKSYVGMDRIDLGIRTNNVLGANVYIKNTSGYPAEKEYGYFHVCISPAEKEPSGINSDQSFSYPSAATENACWRDFLKTIKTTRAPTRTLGPGEGAWGSASISEFDDPLIKQLDRGDKIILVVGSLFFQDDAGSHENDFCRWLQAPYNQNEKTWHSCDVHDGLQR